MPAPEAAGERRHVTVMFCDLVDSTGIAAKLDAEEWRDLVGAYLDAAAAAVTEMGGKVAKKLGDGLMALFGYPVAQENDAERATRAALSIQRALAELNSKNEDTGKPALVARIAVESGPVVVDAAGEIFGDVPNIAARAQALAEPGTLVVTARVQRQVAGLFVAEERGSHELKGVPAPVTLFRVVRASGGGRRSGQRHLTPLIGRDEEIAILMRRWERARQGDGQLVMIVGEPGLGKSRLIEEFHGRLGDTPHTWVEWSCSQLLQNTPLHPIAEWGRMRFGGADLPAEQRLAELESTLAQIKVDPAENVPLLASLLDIPLLAERPPTLTPEELRRRRLAALTTALTASARVQPVVLAVEDLHWADPTTLDLLRGIAERGALAPLFVLATARPEFRPPWGMRSHHGMIALAPLDHQQVRDMVAELSARHALPRDVVDGVTERTGGVPLFVEEVTRLLLERGEQGGIQAIPPTLQQSLTARLDRLGPAREVAQIGAVIGRDFSYSLLRHVTGMEEASLLIALERLAEADILLVQGVPPDSDYRFKHALIQDAAYENLLKGRRQVLHRGVAEILRDRFTDTAAVGPQVLAHHFTQAGLIEPAIEWWGKAGDQALSRSAYTEAVAHFSASLKWADALQDPADRMRRQLDFLVKLGPALMVARGYGSAEVEDACQRAAEIGEMLDDRTALFKAKWGLWHNAHVRRKTALARDRANELLTLAQRSGDGDQLLEAYHCRWSAAMLRGDVAATLDNSRIGVETYDVARHRHLGQAFGSHDPGVCAHLCRAFALQESGDREQAQESGTAAIALAEALDHPTSLGLAFHNLGVCLQFGGDRDATLAAARRAVALAQKFGLLPWRAGGLLLTGWATAVGAGIADAARLIDAEIDNATATSNLPQYFLGLAAEVLLAAGRPADGLAHLDRAIAAIDEPGVGFYLPEIHRLRGECLLSLSRRNKAEARKAFMTARDDARQQGATLFEHRAMARLAEIGK
jgi:class 3 adenylate cyclase/tetratricopeptide (TPR) repeat protein